MNHKKSKEIILELMSAFPTGASVEEIRSKFTTPPARRTLQYQLAALVRSEHLIAEERTRGRKFSLPLSRGIAQVAQTPLSTAAQLINNSVKRPLYERTYVTYSREFLDEYQPNNTYYLSEQLRKHLFSIGQTEDNRPAGTYARQIYSRLLIDLSWNSSRLEGNTYSLLETERLFELGEIAYGKARQDTQMILNHKMAIEFLYDVSGKAGTDRHTILNFHALLADELLPDVSCGALRQISVGISGSVYLPLAVPQMIDECFGLVIEKAKAIVDPFEQAFFLMVHLPYLQPFEDVNKRVSRLAANLPFMRHNLCPLSFVDVPENLYMDGLLGVYELNRVELLAEVFAWAYERSCLRYSTVRKALGEPDPFRMRYREVRKATVAFIVRNQMNHTAAILFIRKQAETYAPKSEQIKLVEVIETELMSLHEGNVARYGLSPADYVKYKLHRMDV